MLGKAGLVAQRELVENLRTRTFWIGILVFPLILVASVVVPSLLDRSTPTRTYSVVDRSGWMLEAIEERSTLPDLEKVLLHALELRRSGSPELDTLPAELVTLTDQLEQAITLVTGRAGEQPTTAGGELPDVGKTADPETAAVQESRAAAERQVVAGFARVFGQVEVAGDSLGGLLPEESLAEVRATRESIRRWWSSLPAERAEAFGTTSRGRYEHLPHGLEGTLDEVTTELSRRVMEGELFAYFVIDDDPVNAPTLGRYVSENLTDDDLRRWFVGLAREVVRERRLAQHDLDPEVVRWVSEPVRFDLRQVGTEGDEEVATQDLVRQWAPPVFVYLLWVAIFSISQMLLSNTVEEKSNRIMEVLLSSVSPVQLMAGKIGGIAMTGLTMIGFWILFFFFAVKGLPSLIGLELDFDLGVILADPIYLGSFVVYFFLGYLFFATLFVGIGSLCSSLKEAQNLQTPVTLMLLVPIFSMIPVARDPNGPLARVLSYIPPFTPFVMMNRAAGPPSLFEYVVTTLLLLAAIACVLWATAKVFRIGVLMTGKPPRLREVFKWLRAPVGTVPERRKPT